jgi:hypothetical protein
VFTARYALSPYIKQIRFVFKGLILLYLLCFPGYLAAWFCLVTGLLTMWKDAAVRGTLSYNSAVGRDAVICLRARLSAWKGDWRLSRTGMHEMRNRSPRYGSVPSDRLGRRKSPSLVTVSFTVTWHRYLLREHSAPINTVLNSLAPVLVQCQS